METASRLGNIWNRLVMDRRNWWLPLAVVMTIGLGSMIFVGTKTYDDAPPIPDFVDAGRPAGGDAGDDPARPARLPALRA
jgi:hypothetical protein